MLALLAMLRHSRHSRHSRSGFTLVECLIVVAVVAILAGLSLPGLRNPELRMARLDAVQALTRVQEEQENYRAQHGLYSSNLSALRGVQPTSPQGRYTLSLSTSSTESYRAVALAAGSQQADSACAAITLDVTLGFATRGPTPACWGP